MPTFDDDSLTVAESERLRVTLGAIGDRVVAPVQFARSRLALSDVHRRRYRRALAGAVAAFVFGALIVWGVSGRSGGHSVEPASESAVAVSTDATAETTPDTGPEPTKVPSSAPDVDGPWYVIEQANVEGGSVEASPSKKGDVRVWISNDDSYAQVLSVRTLSAGDPTTVVGTQSQPISPVTGTLDLIASPGDIPDPQVSTLIGNEMRWHLASGPVLELIAEPQNSFDELGW